MNQPHADLDVIARFRRQLTQLPEPRRRCVGPAAAAAAAALTAIPLAVVLTGTDGSSDALAITRDAGTLQLRIADVAAGAEELTRDLNEAGIDGRVLVVPVEAANAGRWVVTAEVARRTKCIPAPGSPTKEETVRLPDITNDGTVLHIPVDRVRESTGSFILVAGRQARPRERAVDVGSPQAVQLDVLEPVFGRPSARLPAC